MNNFSRRGACPALSAPMQTGDGLLVRVNPATDGIGPTALIGLCEAALRHGNGIVEITARGSLQIRGLTQASAEQLATEVNALDLSVRTGVPVETGPLAGLDPDETVDPRPLAQEIRTAISDANLASRLGPKVSVVVDGGGRLTMDAVLADVRLVAEKRHNGIVWQLSIAGNARTARPMRSIAQAEAPGAVLLILETIAALGREGRAKDLLEGTSPVPTPRQHAESPIASFALANQSIALGLGLPFGSMTAVRLIALIRKSIDLGSTEIRLAPGRALLFLGLSEATSKPLHAAAAELDFMTDADDPRTRIAACPGSPACASGMIETRSLAEEIAATQADFLDSSFTLHVSGCAKGCAHPATAKLTLVGGEKGAGLVVDGTAKSLPVGYRPRYEGARGISRVAAAARAASQPGDTGASSLARLGASSIAQAYRQE